MVSLIEMENLGISKRISAGSCAEDINFEVIQSGEKKPNMGRIQKKVEATRKERRDLEIEKEELNV